MTRPGKSRAASWVAPFYFFVGFSALACGGLDDRNLNVTTGPAPSGGAGGTLDGASAAGSTEMPPGESPSTEGNPDVAGLENEEDDGPRVIEYAPVDTAAACSPGMSNCNSATEVIECGADGRWAEPARCEFACVGSSCGGECTPGSSECLSSISVRTCSTEALWSAPSDCENACLGTLCAGECRPGTSRCASGTEVQLCAEDGLWSPATACENACVGSSCAGECAPGSTECFSTRQLRTCSPEGQWLAATACTNACVDDACGGECVPASRRCDPNSGIPQLCSDAGVWDDQPECQFVCLGSGTCGGECVPGGARCNPVTGIPQTCGAAGTWSNEAECDFVCLGDGVCGGQCAPGTRRCDPVSGVPQLCSATGTFQNQTRCDFECSGNGECTGECNDGDVRCSGDVLQRCVGSEYVFEEQCASAAACNADEGVCVGSNCADDSDPNSTVVSDPTFGCGLSFRVPGDPTGAWLEFASGLHFDTETGIAWIHPFGGGSFDLPSLQAGCDGFELEGIGGWIVPTIDDTRALGAGCAPTEPGGACPVADPGCLSQAACGGCDSCIGGVNSTGRAEDNAYCRPNARICDNIHTSSLCTDCAIPSSWEFGITNGNINPRDITDRITGSYCIRRNFPL